MFDVDLYKTETVKVTSRDALYFIENYIHFLTFKDNEEIMDAGSGEGTITLKCLLPFLPENYKKLECVDINPKMIEIAKNKNFNRKVEFTTLDLCCSDLPSKMVCCFDHIFSFYMLHWIPRSNHKSLFENLYKMMKPGGELFITSIVELPIYRALETLQQMEKWAPYLNEYNKYFSPFYKTTDPQANLTNVLTKSGFSIKCVRLVEMTYTFDKPEFDSAFCSGNYCTANVPIDQQPLFLKEFISEVSKEDCFHFRHGSAKEEMKIDWSYSVLVAVVSKETL